MSGLEARQLASHIQAHFGRAVKERNWSLFLFFRILANDEVQQLVPPSADDSQTIGAAASGIEKLGPEERIKIARAIVESDDVSIDAFAKVMADAGPPALFLLFLNKLLGTGAPETKGNIIEHLSTLGLELPAGDDASPEQKADQWFRQGLLGVCAHECLRYEQASGAASHGYGLLRSETDQKSSDDPAVARAISSEYSNSAVNISFTHSGLRALQTIDKEVLDSFPEAFRQGMAARAKLLRDVGRSAPEYWDGALGKSSIHGLLTAYFPVSERSFNYWDRLREEVEAFNTGNAALRQKLAVLFGGLGFEAQHIDLGQTPYDIGEDGKVHWPEHRLEHFGFRDGISQPFVDLGLKTPPPGGGRPAKDGTWAPVAPGEIFLGPPDEDGLTADQPINVTLRNGGTYLVFRKLEQDVAGFRAYLAKQRETEQEQERLAAQFVGRWRSGAPLVRHPDADASYRGAKAERSINDFRYFVEDARGHKCPIGAHIRRTNPRDTGGGDEVKRHRIMRRGMAYGGPLLPKGSLGDGRERGLLFVAVNARIELQFELIQRDWINGGEFLGQVGAGRCPLTAPHEGTLQDRFLEAGAIAPICGIPSFVFNRGGDYFFVPSVEALKKLARGERFQPDDWPFGPFSASRSETPALLSEGRLKSYSMELLRSVPLPNAPAGTPLRTAIRVRLPEQLRKFGENEPGDTMVFVGHYDDVVEVLGGYTPKDCRANHGQPRKEYNFSVAHYLQAGREITRGEDLLIAMDPGKEFDVKRQRRLCIMRKAWDGQNWWTDFSNGVVRDFIRDTVDHIEHRVAQTGQMDLLQDLAFYIPYRLLEKLVGLPGPAHISELVVALPFAKRYMTNLPADWLRGRQGREALEPGYVTAQMWSRLAFAEVIGNILDKRELTGAAIQATSEMLTHIDEKILEERLKEIDPARPPRTLLEQLVRQAPSFQAPGDGALVPQAPAPDFQPPASQVAGMSAEEYFAEVRAILADLLTTISMNIALPFSKAIQAALAFRLDLAKVVPVLEQATSPPDARYSNVDLLAYELLRLYPSAPAIFRRCETTTTLPSGARINRGEWVAALLAVASRDFRYFPDPNRFSLGTHLPKPLGGASRDPMAYLLFGPPCGVHRCWGEERLGRLVLAELFRATARFKGLSRVAGPFGEVVEFPPRMDYGLRVRFPSFNPNKAKPAVS